MLVVVVSTVKLEAVPEALLTTLLFAPPEVLVELERAATVWLYPARSNVPAVAEEGVPIMSDVPTGRALCAPIASVPL